jgi:NADH-quinone oxidoreductase subunit J
MNEIIFYSAAVLAIATTSMVILSRSPVYAALYLIMSLFGVAMVLYTLGAPFIAALEIIIYAGAIMVLFLFVVMMLNLGADDTGPDLRRPTRKQMILPGVFALALVAIVVAAIGWGGPSTGEAFILSPKALGIALYDRHFLGVELASLILLIGIIGGMHLGRAATAPENVEAAQNATR